MEKLLSFPTTFDGSLPSISLFGERSPIQIGETYNFEGVGPGGEDIVGIVTDAIVLETERQVAVAIHTADDQAHILREQMTDAQFADYKAHPDAYFGKVKSVPKPIKKPYDLFLFLVEAQRGASRAMLLDQLKSTEENAEGLSAEDLLLELCERQVSASGAFKIVDGVITNEPNSPQHRAQAK